MSVVPRTGIALLVFGATLSPVSAQTYTAAPIATGDYGNDPYYYTGLLVAQKRSDTGLSTGSGAVVRDPRVVFSCAHVVFDDKAVDPWLTEVYWYRAWGATRFPTRAEGQRLRDYWRFTGYAAARASSNREAAFALDFVVHYAFENTANGRYAGYFYDGVSALKSAARKQITGYPSGLYELTPTDPRRYQMHHTGPFSRTYQGTSGDYLTIMEVSAGSGNSGGPVWVESGNQYWHAGVHVSGSNRSTGGAIDLAGAFGVGTSSVGLIDDAIRASGGTVVAPTIIAQPTSRRVSSGQAVTFSIAAVGASTYRWLFNGITIPGATTSSLTINNVTPADAGTYQVILGNAGGETRSAVVILSVDSVPTITSQPASQTVVAGGNVTLSVLISSSTTSSYQWRKDGTHLAGATNASLTLTGVQLSSSGQYSVVIRNSVGSVTSAGATITVLPSVRLANLSIRTTMAANQTLIVGVVVNDGARNILVRGVGPTLAAFGLTNAMADPRLELYQSQTRVLENDNWSATLAPAFSSVGAFALPAGTRDAAFLTSIEGARSIQARGTGPGALLVEAYDTGSQSTARLVNVSARNRVGTGDDILIAGFNLSGSGTKRLLIRAIGPKLSAFGVVGFLNDPRLEIFNSSGVRMLENDTWPSILAPTFASVGAFALDAGSRDAAILAIMNPGSYTVQVRGSDGGTGEALIEIYEVP